MRPHVRRNIFIAIAAAALTVAGIGAARLGSTKPAGDVGTTDHEAVATPRESELFPVIINRPSTPRISVQTDLDHGERQLDVSCASCHGNFQPNLNQRSGDSLVEFHQGLHFNHAGMACLTCHNPDNYNTLRLADGSALPFDQVMTLCSQCHAPQARDYARGAHGGMNGYWDRTRGPQHRKNCIDCHDPHAPAFPLMRPTFKPHDRFLGTPH